MRMVPSRLYATRNSSRGNLRMGYAQSRQERTSSVSFAPVADSFKLMTALPNRFDAMEAQEAWNEAQRLLGSGGSLTDATLMLETFIRRGTDLDLNKPAARQLEAWSLLGRVHAMNEKEEKALLAFDEGRQAIPGNEQSTAIGEMLTVSNASKRASHPLTRRISQSRT